MKQIETGQTIDIDSDRREVVGNQPGIQATSGGRFLGIDGGKFAKPGRRRRVPPLRRTQTLHTPALLVDQDCCIRPTDAGTQIAGQLRNLIRGDTVAGKQDETEWFRIGEEFGLVRQQFRPRAAEDVGAGPPFSWV